MNEKPAIGVLALQGAVQPHKSHIEAAGGNFHAVKTPEQFNAVDGLIIPGGESTTMLKLIDRFDLWDSLDKQFKTKPVWGICAGAILLAQTVENPRQKSFDALPITICRNGYGRQINSIHTDINGYTVSFIRAPLITNTGAANIRATHKNDPVWIEYKNTMVTTFHPELTTQTPSPMHQAFLSLVSLECQAPDRK